MAKLHALLFDVDGTLADTERDGHRVAFNQAFAAAGLDWNWSVELYGKLLAVTGGKERILHYLDTYHRDFVRPTDLKGLIAHLHASKTQFYTDLLATGQIPLRPGVKRLLEEARSQGIRLGIATTTTPANVTALLQHSLASDGVAWFDVIAAGDIVPAKKPAPDIFFYAIQHMALDPRMCLAFEDSYNGLQSSLGAGLKTIVTVNDYTRDHDFRDATLVLDHLGSPDQPCQILAGQPWGSPYVSVEMLRQLL